METIFNALTGNKGFSPYPYQQSVAVSLFEGKNVILCAPTGAGKTWAAVLPFLANWKLEQQFADRLIYVLPLRSLATSLYNDIRRACENAFNEVSEYKIRFQKRPYVTIQTGDQKDDPFFEGDIIFTTVDQCLSSYLNMPVSLPQKVANINAGAFIGSLIVFDEFHLLESDKAQKTAIEMLIRLNPFSRFIIMTATLSSKSIDCLKSLLNAE
ncbi:MAG TPA: DEAD/DEAH box helicase, partial [Thermodesulfovibrionia bacterium]|nr:DEAD/DEAH box helicase [Thermodesulfovibrionia bacterium]